MLLSRISYGFHFKVKLESVKLNWNLFQFQGQACFKFKYFTTSYALKAKSNQTQILCMLQEACLTFHLPSLCCQLFVPVCGKYALVASFLLLSLFICSFRMQKTNNFIVKLASNYILLFLTWIPI